MMDHNKNKKGNNGKFTRERIVGAGFVEVSPGVFGKRDASGQVGDTRPSSPRMERDPKKKPARKTRSKKGGKVSNSEGIQYQLLILSYRARPIDAGNGCCKYIEDAFVEKGIIPDDNVFICPRPPIFHQIIGLPPSEHRTEAYLFRIEPEDKS